MASATTTPADILAARRADARSGRIAHTAKVDGSFWAREGCPCYTCRDVLDPTGEIDAEVANTLPAAAPPLERQNAFVSYSPASAATGHSVGTGAGFGYAPVSLTRAATGPALSLGASSTGTLVAHDSKAELVAALQRHIETLREQQEPLANHEGARGHSEMAMMDQEWEELDVLISELEKTLELLQ